MELLEDSARQEVRMSSSDGGLPGMQLFSDGGFVRSVGGRTGKGGFLSIRPTLPRSGLRSALQTLLIIASLLRREIVKSHRIITSFSGIITSPDGGTGSRVVDLRRSVEVWEMHLP